MRRLLGALAALLFLAGNAAAREAGELTQIHYSTVDVAIAYFDGTSVNAKTTTAGDRREFLKWEVFNSGTNTVTVRIFTLDHVDSDRTFSASASDDYVELQLEANTGFRVDDSSVQLIGWMLTPTAVTGGELYVTGILPAD